MRVPRSLRRCASPHALRLRALPWHIALRGSHALRKYSSKVQQPTAPSRTSAKPKPLFSNESSFIKPYCRGSRRFRGSSPGPCRSHREEHRAGGSVTAPRATAAHANGLGHSGAPTGEGIAGWTRRLRKRTWSGRRRRETWRRWGAACASRGRHASGRAQPPRPRPAGLGRRAGRHGPRPASDRRGPRAERRRALVADHRPEQLPYVVARVRPVPVADPEWFTRPADTPAPEEAWTGAMRDWVWHSLGQLSEPDRLVTLLRYFSEASTYEQIAALCGVPVGTVRSRLSHARRASSPDSLRTTADAAHDDVAAVERRAMARKAATCSLRRCAATSTGSSATAGGPTLRCGARRASRGDRDLCAVHGMNCRSGLRSTSAPGNVVASGDAADLGNRR